MAGLSDQGFTVKRFPELLQEGRERATDLFQDLVSPGDIVDTSDSALLGRLVALKTDAEADLWEAAQQVDSAFNPNSATGISLDNLILLSGIPARFENTYSTTQVVLTGDTGTTIPSGSVISSPATNQRFDTIADTVLDLTSTSGFVVVVTSNEINTAYTITYTRNLLTRIISFTPTSSGSTSEILSGFKAQIDSTYTDLIATIEGDSLRITLDDVFNPATIVVSNNLAVNQLSKLADVQAENYGPIEQPFNTLTTIVTPRLGWTSVYNPIAAIAGRFRETDEELRLRFRNTKFERSTGTVESIYAALFSLDNVEQVYIEENDTNITNANGVPGHSFLVLIDGGVSAEIARAIWENRPGGILSVGNTTVTIKDKYGYDREISFSRPTPIPIFIQLSLTTDQNFPENGQDKIREAIINYLESLTIGQDVVYSRLYTPINSIPGHQVNSLLIGTDINALSTSNIVIPFDGIAQGIAENITFV